jgi:hypothetical protein
MPTRVKPSGSLRTPTWKARPPVNSSSKFAMSSAAAAGVTAAL